MMLQNKNKSKIKYLYTAVILLAVYFAGFFTAKSYWFNKHFYHYPKLESEVSMDIKSLESYNKKLFNEAETQSDINIASGERYEQYHKYYKRVVKRIKNYDFGYKIVNKAISDYLDGYEKRKAEITKAMFPCVNNTPEDDCFYGTIFGLRYSNAMLEFDRQELITYRMLLMFMYSQIPDSQIDEFFKE